MIPLQDLTTQLEAMKDNLEAEKLKAMAVLRPSPMSTNPSAHARVYTHCIYVHRCAEFT
jgi:hypothetical protein